MSLLVERLLRHILRLDALERYMLYSSLVWCTHSDYALGSQGSLMLFAVVASIWVCQDRHAEILPNVHYLQCMPVELVI